MLFDLTSRICDSANFPQASGPRTWACAGFFLSTSRICDSVNFPQAFGGVLRHTLGFVLALHGYVIGLISLKRQV